MTSSNRDDYLEHGIQPVEFDGERAFREVRDEDGNVDFVENKDYDHDGEIKSRAKALHPLLAPTVDLSDMPQIIPENMRQKLFDRMRPERLEKISRQALEFELTPPPLYWHQAHMECVPVLRDRAVEACREKDLKDAERIATDIVATTETIVQEAEKPSSLVGGKAAIEAFATVAFDPGIGFSRSEREMFLAHFVMQSRKMNQAMRRFEKEAGHLSDSAAPVIDLIREGHLQPEIMGIANSYNDKDRSALVEAMRTGQRETHAAATRELDELRGGPATDRRHGLAQNLLDSSVSLKACGKALQKAHAQDGESLSGLRAMRQVNSALYEIFPLGSGHQVPLVGMDIASARSAQLQMATEKLFKTLGNERP